MSRLLFTDVIAPSISSAFNLSMIEGAAPSPANLPDIIITDSGSVDITAGNDLVIEIPAGLNAIFNTGQTGSVGVAGGTGGAAAAVNFLSTTRARIDTTGIYDGNEVITVSGLEFVWASTTESSGNLDLHYNGTFASPVSDDKVVSILSSSTATSITWDGSVDTDWSDPDNWTPANVPDTSSESALIPSAPANQPAVSGPGLSIAIDSLVIDPGATLTVGDNSFGATSIEVNGTFNASGQGASRTVSVSGYITGSGTFTAGAGTVTAGGDVSVDTFTAGTGDVDIDGAVSSATFTASSGQTNIGGSFSSALNP